MRQEIKASAMSATCDDCCGLGTVPRDDERHPGNDTACRTCGGLGDVPGWWESTGNILDLVLYLAATDGLASGDSRFRGVSVDGAVRTICELLEKPWHWDTEYKEMRESETLIEQLEASVKSLKSGSPQ